MDNAIPVKDIAYWKEKAMSEQFQKSYYESKTEKLNTKLDRALGELQDTQCELSHAKHINEFLRLVIADN